MPVLVVYSMCFNAGARSLFGLFGAPVASDCGFLHIAIYPLGSQFIRVHLKQVLIRIRKALWCSVRRMNVDFISSCALKGHQTIFSRVARSLSSQIYNWCSAIVEYSYSGSLSLLPMFSNNPLAVLRCSRCVVSKSLQITFISV